MTATGHRRAGVAAPASIWDFPEHGSRGPKPRHNRAAIAALAVRIADAECLEAVTMRRLAGELGIAVMSLYNYVPARDHLAQLMTDNLAAEYAYPGTSATDPRAAIAVLARQTRDIARRHPWLAGLLHRPMPPGPNGLRYLDCFLGLLAGSRLGTGAKLELITMISGFATLYGAMQAAPAGQPASAAEQAQPLARAAAGGRYPHLAAALATADQPRSHTDIFGSSIERLIDLARLRLQRPGICVNKFVLTTQIQLSCPAARADGQDRRRRQAHPPAERRPGGLSLGRSESGWAQNSPFWHALASVAICSKDLPERRVGHRSGQDCGDVAWPSWR
jgi:AcrR family transcriptional regulator